MFPTATFLLQRRRRSSITSCRLIRRADQVNRGGEVRSTRGSCNHRAREEELGQGWCTSQAKVEREVFRGEDQTLEERGGRADLGEVCEGFGGFDEGEEGDWGALLALFLLRECVGDDVRDEGEVGRGVDFGEDDGGEVGGLKLFIFSHFT